MTQHVWLNGEILPAADARIGVTDRGFQFADGVYEVIRLYDGRPFALGDHLRRLWNSAVDIQLTPPLTPNLLAAEVGKLLSRTDAGDGQIYMQLTRGCAPRNHVFPETSRRRCCSTSSRRRRSPPPARATACRCWPCPTTAGGGAGSRPRRCWPTCWPRTRPWRPGSTRRRSSTNGCVTECSTSNLFAVVAGKLVTHPVGPKVLPGVTRAVVMDLAAKLGIEVDERPIRLDEAPRADELFVTSTTREVAWVSRWNDIYIGCGRCGRVTAALQRAVRDRVRADTGSALEPTRALMPAG